MFFFDRQKKLLIAGLVLLVILISGTIYIKMHNKTELALAEPIQNEVTVTPTSAATPMPESVEEEELTVYICGYVKKPGNVTVEDGTRLGDVLSLVGGIQPEADLTAVNLAHKLCDEEMIYIPKKGEKPKLSTAVSASSGGATASVTDTVININSASAAQLDGLPGVGPSTAKKIISYRNEKGRFNTIEDIKNVPGIGDKKFKDLKDKIRVD